MPAAVIRARGRHVNPSLNANKRWHQTKRARLVCQQALANSRWLIVSWAL
jgi:hypothetical protein